MPNARVHYELSRLPPRPAPPLAPAGGIFPLRAPTTNLGAGGRSYVDHKDRTKPRRRHRTVFNITINTNKPVPADEQSISAVKGAFRYAVSAMQA